MSTVVVVQEGKCTCVKGHTDEDPLYWLELGENYRYKLMKSLLGGDVSYYRLHEKDSEIYNTCSVYEFKKHFEVNQEKIDAT